MSFSEAIVAYHKVIPLNVGVCSYKWIAIFCFVKFECAGSERFGKHFIISVKQCVYGDLNTVRFRKLSSIIIS